MWNRVLQRYKEIDQPLFLIVLGLVLFGFFVFLSALLSVLAEDVQLFYRILFKQVLFGLVGGIAVLYAVYHVPTEWWRRYALVFFIVSLIATALVFVPGLGFRHGGATRWLDLGFTSFQPAELLKIGVVLVLGAWFAYVKKGVGTFRHGLLPVLVVLGVSGGVLLAQPDTGTFIVLVLAAGSMYYAAGAKWKHIGIFVGCLLLGIGILVAARPYVFDRFATYFDADRDPLGSSWQVRQSLIAIGAGGAFGRGYGQSIQKFNYLPEPAGDSVFAVLGEELGFAGALTLLLLYVAFMYRCVTLARRVPDIFGGLVVVGLAILIVGQSLVNIGSAIHILPLTGLPLIFVSQGGTALLLALFSVGIIFRITASKQKHMIKTL